MGADEEPGVGRRSGGDAPDIALLRASLVGVPDGEGSRRSRVRSIILNERESFPVADGALPVPLAPPSGFDADDVRRLREIVARSAPSVGRVEVRGADGRWRAVCSCFRVAGSATRVASAGHLMRSLLLPGTSIAAFLPTRVVPAAALREARVNFTDQPDWLESDDPPERAGEAFALREVRWTHRLWDLVLLDLEDADDALHARPPLALEDDPRWMDRVGDARVCIVGYPVSGRRESPFVLERLFPPATRGRKHAALGLCRVPVHDSIDVDVDPATRHIRHDASTLAGSSGSPLISLASARVVGLHFHGRGARRGGRFDEDAPPMRDPNVCVNLPLAQHHEPRLRAELAVGGDVAAAGAPIRWRAEPLLWTPDDADDGTERAGDGARGAVATFPRADSELFASVVADRPDERDRRYRPTLLAVPDEIRPPKSAARRILDQGDEPACAGYALATAINRQLGALGRGDEPVSERMLHEMAKLHDEWLDEGEGGTSLRGAIKGFYNNGVCLARTAPFEGSGRPWTLSIAAAKEARSITLGAYYRVRANMLDFQLALGEVGAVLVSARVHGGWIRPRRRRIGRIRHARGTIGHHAFVILGYDREGFVIQNSWGPEWSAWQGRPGLAHWRYEDWAENLLDAWVLRLAPRTPDAFDLVPRIARDAPPDDGVEDPLSPRSLPALPRPRRFTLIGHVLQLERDRVVDRGRLGMGLASLRETALYLGGDEGRERYPRIALLFHDPTLGGDALGRLFAATIEPLKRRGVYPLHVVYGLDEVRTTMLRLLDEARRWQRRFGESGEDLSAHLERRARQIAGPLLRAQFDSVAPEPEPDEPLWQALGTVLYESAGARGYCLYASGLGYRVARRVLGALDFATVPRSADDTAAASLSPRGERGRGGFERRFLLAPAGTLERCLADLDAGGDHDDGKAVARARLWRLDAARGRSPWIAGYRGDWADLCLAALGGESVAGGVRADERTGAGGDRRVAVARDCRFLHEACVDAAVRKSLLDTFGGRT